MKNYLIKAGYDLELDQIETTEIVAEKFRSPLEFNEILAVLQ